jgi:hypothetical protein
MNSYVLGLLLIAVFFGLTKARETVIWGCVILGIGWLLSKLPFVAVLI